MPNIKDFELYDWFAGQALAGILANSQFPPKSSGEPMDQYVARVVDSAYRLADSMVKEGCRLKKERSAQW